MYFNLWPFEWGKRDWVKGELSIVGNVLQYGPSTPNNRWLFQSRGPIDFHMRDNLHFNKEQESVEDHWHRQVPMPSNFEFQSDQQKELIESSRHFMAAPSVWPEGLVPIPAAETRDAVLHNVGARPWDRDAVDLRLIEEARSGGGSRIDSQSEVP